MTNEELAAAVKAGREDLITELWEQCVNYIRFQASRWALAWKGKRHDFDYDDFVQAGYFALLQAVEKWEPGRGGFIGFLDLCLKTAFAEVAGCRTTAQKQDVIYNSARLESPIPGNQSADKERTLADTIGGECDGLEALEDADYKSYIAKAVRECLATLPERQRQAIEGHYLRGMNYAAIAEDFGISLSRAQQLAQKGMRQIRQSQDGKKLCRLYFGHRNQYRATGFGAWKATGCSQPEREVLKIDSLRRRFDLDTRAGKIAYCIYELGFTQEQAERIFPE